MHLFEIDKIKFTALKKDLSSAQASMELWQKFQRMNLSFWGDFTYSRSNPEATDDFLCDCSVISIFHNV